MFIPALMTPTRLHLFAVCCQIDIMTNVYLNILLSMTTIFGLKAAHHCDAIMVMTTICPLMMMVRQVTNDIAPAGNCCCLG